VNRRVQSGDQVQIRQGGMTNMRNLISVAVLAALALLMLIHPAPAEAEDGSSWQACTPSPAIRTSG
jgi:hypothetical protein